MRSLLRSRSRSLLLRSDLGYRTSKGYVDRNVSGEKVADGSSPGRNTRLGPGLTVGLLDDEYPESGKTSFRSFDEGPDSLYFLVDECI